LIGSIGFINTTAYWTSLAGVPRINEDHWDACQLSLVSNIALKLIERPVSVLASLLASKRCPIANTLQSFKGNRSTGVLRFSNKTLADRVICVGLKPGLLAGDFLEFALCRFGLLLLKVLTAMLELAAVIIHSLTAELFAIAVNSQVDYSKIATQNIVNILRLRSFDLAGGEQVEIAVDQGKVAFSPLALEKFLLTLPANIRDALATFDCPDRDLVQINIPPQDTAIESNRSVWLESTFRLAVNFIAVNHFRDATHNNLSGKVELLTNNVVNQFVERDPGKPFVLPRLLRDVIAGSVGRLKCLFESIKLLMCWLKLYLGSEFHAFDYTTTINTLKGAAFLSPVNGGVSSGIFL